MRDRATANKTVFISYSHDSAEHEDCVLAWADRLIDEGVDCVLDKYNPHPPEGWPLWMDRQIRDATFVLMVCTETYYQRVMREEKPGIGLGVQWESTLIYTYLYDNAASDDRFIPVLLDGAHQFDIPAPVRGRTFYRADTDEGYDGLYRHLTKQPSTPKPPLGTPRVLPPRQRLVPSSGLTPSDDVRTPDDPFDLSVGVSLEKLAPAPAFENIPVLAVAVRNVGIVASYVSAIDMHATVDGREIVEAAANHPDDLVLQRLTPSFGTAIDPGRKEVYKYRLKTLTGRLQEKGSPVALTAVSVHDEVGHVYTASVSDDINSIIGEPELMERHIVSSSNLRDVGYSKGTQTLEVRFHNGGIYRYYKVPESVFRSLLTAHSKGSFLHVNIKSTYPYKKVC